MQRTKQGFFPRKVWITGATGAIGCALAQAYAAPGISLTLFGQREDQLKQVAGQCEELGAKVDTVTLNFRDANALRSWVTVRCQTDAPDLLIANAGVNINIGDSPEGECWEDMERLLEVNVISTMALVSAVLPAMRQRGNGQIALVSSLAAYYGLPMTPSYSASKAAIKAYGEGLRGWLAPEGIRINVIMPGYVSSPMCDAMPGPKPFLWPPEKAARVIRRGLARDQARISFPFPLNYGTWWLAVLPSAISQQILRWIGYRA